MSELIKITWIKVKVITTLKWLIKYFESVAWLYYTTPNFFKEIVAFGASNKLNGNIKVPHNARVINVEYNNLNIDFWTIFCNKMAYDADAYYEIVYFVISLWCWYITVIKKQA